jgi:hypothetical protein
LVRALSIKGGVTAREKMAAGNGIARGLQRGRDWLERPASNQKRQKRQKRQAHSKSFARPKPMLGLPGKYRRTILIIRRPLMGSSLFINTDALRAPNWWSSFSLDAGFVAEKARHPNADLS